MSRKKCSLIISPGRCGTKFIIDILSKYFTDESNFIHESFPISQVGFIFEKFIKNRNIKITHLLLMLKIIQERRNTVCCDPILLNSYMYKYRERIYPILGRELIVSCLLTREFIPWLCSMNNRISITRYSDFIKKYPSLGFTGPKRLVNDLILKFQEISMLDICLAASYINIHVTATQSNYNLKSINYEQLFNTSNERLRKEEWKIFLKSINIYKYNANDFDDYLMKQDTINASPKILVGGKKYNSEEYKQLNEYVKLKIFKNL